MRLADAPVAVDELVAVPAAVAQEVAVDLAVEAVADAPQHAVPLAGDRVAAQAAVHADRRGGLEVPLAGVVLLERLVGEDAGGADLHQVAAELAFQRAVRVAAEVDVVVPAQDVEVAPAGVVAVEPHAAVALDAAVHLVVDERARGPGCGASAWGSGSGGRRGRS